MNKKQVLLGLAILLVLLFFSLWAAYVALQWFQSLNASVAAALTTALVGLVGLWYAQWQSKTRDIAESHRASKIEVYDAFFDIVEKFQRNNVDVSDGENIPEWLKEGFRKLNRGLIVWGSPGVIAAYLKFRTTSTGGGNILAAVDEMYREIRKDLGNSNFRLRPGDLIRIGLKDPNELK